MRLPRAIARFGQVLATATCQGFATIVREAEPTDGKLLLPSEEEEWRQFLEHALTIALPLEGSSAVALTRS
jgi:hypothetical protein